MNRVIHVTASELAQAITKLLIDPQSTGAVATTEQYQYLFTSLAGLVCEVAGGELVAQATLLPPPGGSKLGTPGQYAVGIEVDMLDSPKTSLWLKVQAERIGKT